VDDAKTGAETMAELAKLMNGKGKVAILAGNQNAPNLQHRVQGAKDEAAKHPGMQVIGTFNHIETPQDAASEVIRVNNAYPDIQGWAMIGGWPLFTQTLLTDLDPKKQKVVAVDALPDELPYIEKGIAPVLLAQPVYKWGDVGVRTIFEKLHDKKDPPQAIMPMELVRVSKENLGAWARQLKDWGFTNVNPAYLKL
jgi:ribose transport system substrate-binding protein